MCHKVKGITYISHLMLVGSYPGMEVKFLSVYRGMYHIILFRTKNILNISLVISTKTTKNWEDVAN